MLTKLRLFSTMFALDKTYKKSLFMDAANTPTPPSSSSTKTLKSPVIVCNSWGNYHVYPGTVEFARKLLEDTLMSSDSVTPTCVKIMNTLNTSKERPQDLTIPYLVSDGVVLQGMKDLLELGRGQASQAFCQLAAYGEPKKGAKLEFTKAQRNELVLWAFENKFKVETATARDLEKTRPEQSLSFMDGLVHRAGGRTIKYEYESDMQNAKELQTLLYGTWKPAAKIESIIQRYLKFLNDHSHRDQNYHLGVMETPVMGSAEITAD